MRNCILSFTFSAVISELKLSLLSFSGFNFFPFFYVFVLFSLHFTSTKVRNNSLLAAGLKKSKQNKKL